MSTFTACLCVSGCLSLTVAILEKLFTQRSSCVCMLVCWDGQVVLTIWTDSILVLLSYSKQHAITLTSCDNRPPPPPLFTVQTVLLHS